MVILPVDEIYRSNYAGHAALPLGGLRLMRLLQLSSRHQNHAARRNFARILG